MPGAVDTDDACEPAVAPRLHPSLGVLDDDGALRSRAQPSGRFQQHSGIGLAGQAESFGVQAVDANGEQVTKSGRLQHVFAVAARRIDGRRDPGFGQRAHQNHRRLENRHTGIEPLEKDLLLAVAEPVHAVIGAVESGSPGGSAIPRDFRKSATPSSRGLPSTKCGSRRR